MFIIVGGKGAGRQKSVCCRRQKSVLDLGGKRVYTIVGGKRVFAVGGKRVFLNWAAKECLSFRSAKESFVVWAAKECLLLWAAKEFLPLAEKEFSSYAAKVRVAKDRESTELQPYKRDHIVQIVPFLSILN